MSLKKLIASIGIVLITVVGGASIAQSHAHAVPAPSAPSASIDPGEDDGDGGIWP